MTRSRTFGQKLRDTLAGLLVCFLSSAVQVRAAEPTVAFLQALREDGYHDIALNYLDRMRTSPLADAEFKATIAFEEGITLLEMAKQPGQSGQSTVQALDTADAKFDEFIRDQANHPLVESALQNKTVVVIQRADMHRARAESEPKEREAELASARKLYDQAGQLLEQRRQSLKQRLSEFPKSVDPKKQAALYQSRTQLRSEYVQSRLLLATVLFEKASTIDGQASNRRALLQQAAEAFNGIAKDYPNRLAGLMSLFYRGRCHQEMDDFKEALSLYEELLQQPNQAHEFRQLKTRAMRHAIECWTHDSVSQADKAIEQARAWIDEIRQNEANSPDWLAVRWLLAKTLNVKSQSADRPSEKRQLLAEAAKHAEVVADSRGPFTRDAQELLAVVRSPKAKDDRAVDMMNYAECLETGETARENMERSLVLIKLLRSGDSTASDSQIMNAEKTIAENRVKAVRCFRRALILAGAEVGIDEINTIRHALCYLYYLNGDYHDAAVLGSFLARRYPGANGARRAARIALASYSQLLNERGKDDSNFTTERMIKTADYISQYWPDTPDAEEALSTLINLLVIRGEMVRAEEYLKRISVTSERRMMAELRTGQGLWAEFLRKRKLAGSEGSTVNVASLTPLRARAEKLLADGLGRASSETINASVAAAALSLAQLYLDAKESAKALEVLEHDIYGAKTLTDRRSPLSQAPGFTEAAYRTTLRAAIGSIPKSRDSSAAIGKAVEITKSLKEVVGQSDEGKRRLTAVYLSVARDLQSQMEAAPASVKRNLASGFEVFLNQVASDSREPNTLYWVAETFSGLGKGFDHGDRNLSPDASKYYQRAAQTFQHILSANQQGEIEMDAKMSTQVGLRLAMAHRVLRDYQAAIDTLAMILGTNGRLLNVQQEAAKTYQQWGESGRTEYFDLAIRGGHTSTDTGENLIWGWAKLATIAARQMNRGAEYRKRYSDVFHDARYNMALARFTEAMLQSGSEQTDSLKRARAAIVQTQALYPKLGGAIWKSRYESLLEQIDNGLSRGRS